MSATYTLSGNNRTGGSPGPVVVWTGDVQAVCVCAEMARITCHPSASFRLIFDYTGLGGGSTATSSSSFTEVALAGYPVGQFYDRSHGVRGWYREGFYFSGGSPSPVRITSIKLGFDTIARIPAPPDGVFKVKVCIWLSLWSNPSAACGAPTWSSSPDAIACWGNVADWDKVYIID